MWNRIAAGALAGLLLPLIASAARIQAEIETLQSRPIAIYANFPGTVVPSEYVQVASSMSGYATGLRVDVGQSVKQGELLLTVNPTEVNANVQQASSQLTKAQDALTIAEENYARFKNLFAQGAVPKQRFQEVELAYKAAKSDVTTAQAGLDKARNQVGYAELRAPFDGVVFSKKVNNGQLVSPGQELLVLYDPTRLQVRVEVDNTAYYRLREGEKVPVQYASGDRRPQQVGATVESLVAAVDPATHTHTVKLLLPAGAGAKGGEYARVMVPMEQRPALLVPQSAVYKRAGITGVFVQDTDGNAQFRMVTLGERRGDQRLVLSGLFPGDRLVVSAQGDLANGVALQAEGK